MLPSFKQAGGYYTASKKKRRNEEAPWGLLLLLLLAGSCALFTRHRSLANVLSDYPDPQAPFLTRSLDEISRDAAYNFTPSVHATYHRTVPIQQPTQNILRGGWQFTDAVYDYATHHPTAEVISMEAPRVVVFRSFMSPDEVDHLIGLAKDHLERSSVLSADESEDRIDDVRTSFGMWPPVDDFMNGIEQRIHRLVGIPQAFGEQIYALNYKLNQRYDAHNDNCMDNIAVSRTADDACRTFLQRSGGPSCGPGNGGASCGDRIATMILVLKAPSEGGRTVFPSAALTKQRLKDAGESEANDGGDAWYCERDEVLGVTANPGDAILFWDYEPHGGGDGTGSFLNGTANPTAKPVPESLHSGCPVLAGEKWIATRWIRASQFI